MLPDTIPIVHRKRSALVLAVSLSRARGSETSLVGIAAQGDIKQVGRGNKETKLRGTTVDMHRSENPVLRHTTAL